jgi:uncharacterized protein (TIGR02271 family)
MADDDSKLSGRSAFDEVTAAPGARLTGRDDDAVKTRSEEELWIATVRRETQRARLTRYVETETVTKSVEVRHEQVRVEYEPVLAGDELDRSATEPTAHDEGWVVLYDEEVVMTTRRVPRERVRLRTHTVTEGREITERLRKERIEVNDPTRTR